MKNTLIRVVSFCVLFLTVFFLLPKTADQNTGNIRTNLMPEDVVKNYVDSSLKGDEEAVSSLVTQIPESYSFECQNSNNTDYSQSLKTSDLIETEVSNRLSEPISIDEDQNNPQDKFLGLINSKSKNSVAFLQARYIFTTQAVIREIKVLNSDVYQDEAIVNVQYIISQSNIYESKFLLKKLNNDWKVFMTVSPKSLGSTINENYAKPRPSCK